jgi:perosamine synthetase
VLLAGATPVLCEVREDTFCLDMKKAEALVTPRTKAVMPVHIYGQAADMTEVMSFATRHGLRVVEDAAEAIGVRFQGQHAGTFGDIGMISYYGNKTVTCGEGGMVLTNDDGLAKAAYRLKNYGRDQKGTFIHESIGFNFSFTDLQAAVGVAQMKKMPAIVQRKREIRDRYVAELADCTAIRPVYIDPRCEPVFWFTSFLCDDPAALGAFLRERDIQTRRFFYPLHLQPCYTSFSGVKGLNQDFSVSESIYNRGISLPSFYGLTADDQSYVIDQIRRFYADRG